VLNLISKQRIEVIITFALTCSPKGEEEGRDQDDLN
jgi:hypothetical protein